jgi:GTP cyclohydrolase I
MAVARALDVPVVTELGPNVLVVDDLVDSGATALKCGKVWFDALYRKPHSPKDIAPFATEVDGWIEFPWEEPETGPTDAVVRLLQFIGEDPTREGLLDTPKRVTKALLELTSGYHQSAADILSKTFDERCDEMVVVTGIEFSSMCEHHMLPFTGIATVGYIPNGSVVGLSKLARLVEMYAKRLQVQERMTEQIADAIRDHLDPLGCGVIITSHHSCMGMRGIKKANAKMTTSALHGVMRNDHAARTEFLSHHRA